MVFVRGCPTRAPFSFWVRPLGSFSFGRSKENEDEKLLLKDNFVLKENHIIPFMYTLDIAYCQCSRAFFKTFIPNK